MVSGNVEDTVGIDGDVSGGGGFGGSIGLGSTGLGSAGFGDANCFDVSLSVETTGLIGDGDDVTSHFAKVANGLCCC